MSNSVVISKSFPNNYHNYRRSRSVKYTPPVYMIVGTSHFVNLQSAIQYYKDYGYTENDVKDKIIAKEISLDRPEIISGESLRLGKDGRYEILKPY